MNPKPALNPRVQGSEGPQRARSNVQSVKGRPLQFCSAPWTILQHVMYVSAQEARSALDDSYLQLMADQAQQLRSRDKIISEMRCRQQALVGAAIRSPYQKASLPVPSEVS